MAQQFELLKAALADRYAIERDLGSGGMATVYLAEDLKHHRKVAVKVLLPDLASALGPERFLQEIETVAQLHHPHILPLYDSGETEGFLYYTMPFVEGESLRDRLEREKQLPIDESLHIAREVADGLSFAHSHDVVHRDIKPDNILLEAGHAIVADFGIARAITAAGGERLTTAGMVVGTAAYMSPEQAAGSEEVDGRSDLYSLGCVLYEMLAGQPPFTGPTTESILHQHLAVEPPSVANLRPAVPAEVAGILARALAKTPADRFNPAAQFAEALVQTSTQTAVMPVRRAVLPTNWIVSSSLLAVIVILVALWRLTGTHEEPRPVSQPQQITFDGTVLEATLSADGQFIAYISHAAGEEQRLMVAELSGGTPLEIYSHAFLCCVQWSPDGGQLAFREGTRSAGRAVIIPRLGATSPREITAEVITRWSPDGSQIASWWPQAKTVWLTDVSTGDTTASLDLTMPHVWVNGIDWSPDGERLAVAVSGDLGSAVWTIATKGGNTEPLLQDSIVMFSPNWSRDGTAVYYLWGDDNRALEVRKVDVANDGTARGPPTLVRSGLSVGVRHQSIPVLSVTRDGKNLLYPRQTRHSNLWLFEVEERAGARAIQSTQFTRGTAQRWNPRLSPDGSSVAFVQSTAEESAIFVAALPGGAMRQLTFMNAGAWSPAWSPDGNRIAFGSDQGGANRVWAVDADGGTARSFEETRLDAGNRLAWAPGEDILYQLPDDQNYHLLDADDEVERPLMPSNEIGWLYQPRSSPDGRHVAAWWNRTDSLPDGLWIISSDDGSHFLLREGFNPIGWTANGEALYAMPNLGNDAPTDRMYVIPLSGGEPEFYITLPFVTSRHVSITADGLRIVAALEEAQADAWLVENFDPNRR